MDDRLTGFGVLVCNIAFGGEYGNTFRCWIISGNVLIEANFCIIFRNGLRKGMDKSIRLVHHFDSNTGLIGLLVKNCSNYISNNVKLVTHISYYSDIDSRFDFIFSR